MKPPLAQFQSDKRKEREEKLKLLQRVEKFKEMENLQRRQNHDAFMKNLKYRNELFGVVKS